MNKKSQAVLAIIVSFLLVAGAYAGNLGNYQKYQGDSHSGYQFTSKTGQRLRISPSGNYIVRIQAVDKGENFLPDDHYEMVADHDMGGKLALIESDETFILKSKEYDGIKIVLSKNPMRLSFYNNSDNKLLVKDKDGVTWDGTRTDVEFIPSDEHFCGAGHPAYSRLKSLDLAGEEVTRNYMEQAPLLVPFYIASGGYGILLNSTFENRFRFNYEGEYSFGIDDHGYDGQMDYYFIIGPKIPDILDRYTQLTGRPRMPQKSMFGLQLSDKGSPNESDEQWWMGMITEHREAEYPIDHIVNDNRWRAGSGAWAGSRFEWAVNEGRYPDPARWGKWVKENGLTMTLDLNRNSAANSWGWKPEFNIPNADCVKNGNSTPDYSSQVVRDWNWELFWNKSLNPALGYPGDALWMDEPDDIGCIPDDTIMADGRSWAENKNAYFYLISKAVVQQGWDNENDNTPPGIGAAKRPFVWVRGQTAGGQRYATHWSGDIRCDRSDMKDHVRAMQASGLSGFPYYNHDAGGFHSPGPDDALYRQWSMAFGSFSPIWRPHGPGANDRWPMNRSDECQKAAHLFSNIRYTMMPYIYTLAYLAHNTGVPMARAMVIDYQDESEAWKHDLQYMWGDSMLIAPNCGEENSNVEVWLPGGNRWYDLFGNKWYDGGQVISIFSAAGTMPMFIKDGAILPKAEYALSTFWIPKEVLTIDVYGGADGKFDLYEDDGVTEYFRLADKYSITPISYKDSERMLTIGSANGNYDGKPKERAYKIIIRDVAEPVTVTLNGETIKAIDAKGHTGVNGSGYYYNDGQLRVVTGKTSLDKQIVIKF